MTTSVRDAHLHFPCKQMAALQSPAPLMFLSKTLKPNSVVPVVKPQEEGGVTEQLYAEIKPAVEGANYIIKHMRNKNDYNEEKDNWSGIARTVDRLCLFLVTPVMTFGTIIIFLMGIYNHPPHLPFQGDPHNYREDNPRLLL